MLIFLPCYFLKCVSGACHLPLMCSSPCYFYFRCVWVNVTPPHLLTRRELDLVLTGLLPNNIITLVIFYDLLNTWCLLNLSWVYLLLTSQILYMFVKHMQKHANNENGGKIMNYSVYILIKLWLTFYSYGQKWQFYTTTYTDSILHCFFVVVNRLSLIC